MNAGGAVALALGIGVLMVIIGKLIHYYCVSSLERELKRMNGWDGKVMAKQTNPNVSYLSSSTLGGHYYDPNPSPRRNDTYAPPTPSHEDRMRNFRAWRPSQTSESSDKYVDPEPYPPTLVHMRDKTQQQPNGFDRETHHSQKNRWARRDTIIALDDAPLGALAMLADLDRRVSSLSEEDGIVIPTAKQDAAKKQIEMARLAQEEADRQEEQEEEDRRQQQQQRSQQQQPCRKRTNKDTISPPEKLKHSKCEPSTQRDFR
eukprot:m.132686 g.132686  ORF g.132686 m.132686 type:complete len:260 (-) comp29627_c1_seq1:344-1123(-)